MNITAKYLTKVYNNGVYALDGFTADIKSGEFVAVLGASGCGKTTLLRLFAGLEKPTAGELYFNGVLFKDLPISKRDTAIVFQEYVLYPKMTVWENVAVALERYDLTRAEEEKRAGADKIQKSASAQSVRRTAAARCACKGACAQTLACAF